jgi:hypothetical protein
VLLIVHAWGREAMTRGTERRRRGVDRPACLGSLEIWTVPMAGKQQFTKQQVKEALEACRGLTSVAARRLGCAHQTVLNYMARYPDVQAVAERMRALMTDLAEVRYWAAIRRGEPWAIAMQLKTQGRDRGYTEAPDLVYMLHQVVQTLAAEYQLPLEEVMREAEEIRRRRG